MKRCWQIREEYAKQSKQWPVACAGCAAMLANISCWELDTPACCADVHVSCDFCCLYIVHRREIAGLSQEDLERA